MPSFSVFILFQSALADGLDENSEDELSDIEEGDETVDALPNGATTTHSVAGDDAGSHGCFYFLLNA